MRYTIRRIRLGSAIRVGLLLGWLAALCPALCLAGLAVQALRGVDGTFDRVAPVTISLLGQDLARIDLLEALGLRQAAQAVDRLVGSAPTTFVLITLLLLLAGALAIVAALALFSLGYNLLAAVGGGLEVDLDERRSRKETL
jgi:hypothetical protein